MSLFKKKPRSENLEELRDITDDVIEADFVPYACHWDPHTLVTNNGEVLQTLQVTGLASDGSGASVEDADLRAHIREAILACVRSTQYAVWIHTIRRKKNLATKGEFKRDFAGYLDRFWKDRHDWENQFANEVYVTVVRVGEGAKLLEPQGFLRGIIPRFDMRHRERYLDDSAAKLDKVMEKMTAMLATHGVRRLGVSQKDGVYYSDITKFLGKLTTMLDLDFPLKDMGIASQITDYDVTFGFNTMEVRLRESGKRRFGALLTIKEYRELSTQSLDRVLQLPAEFIISQCFDFIQSKFALKNFEYQKELFDVSKSKVLAEKIGLTDILASDRGRETDFGEHQLSIFVLGDSVRVLESSVAFVSEALGTLGMIPMREDIKFEEGYWAQLPANFEFIRRMRPINTARLGGFANLSSFPAGHQEGNLWGPAITTLYTVAHTPYFFNFHVEDNGHTTIVSPPGAGKTVLLNFLLAQSRKFGGKLFFFDRDRGSEIFLRSIGGSYVNPFPGADPRAYAQVGLNPFQMEDTETNRTFLSQWMLLLAGARAPASLLDGCTKAVAQVMMLPAPERNLVACIAAVSTIDPAAAPLFLPWTTGLAATVFNAAQDTLSLADIVCGFEMGNVVATKPLLAPMLAYLLHRVTLALDGTPTIVVLDEAWALLDHPFLREHLSAWMDELKSHNAIAIFATDYVKEMLNSELNAVLRPRITTQILLPDEDAEAGYARAFGLEEKEISYLTAIHIEDRHFLIKSGNDAIIAELNLAGMADIMAVLSATPAHLVAMEQVIEKHSLTPAEWMPRFLELI